MAATLTRDQVRRIAELARLELSEPDVDRFTTQLSTILAYVAELGRIDTTGVAPTAHALTDGPHWRADDPAPGLSIDEALANAPDATGDAGLFRVPKVL